MTTNDVTDNDWGNILRRTLFIAYVFPASPDRHHGLRGRASPVLTATGFVYGRGQFLTPTESTPTDAITKKFVKLISDKCKKLNSLKHLVRTTVAGSHN